MLALLALLSASVAAKAADPARVAVAFDLNGERGAWSDGTADPATGRAVTPDDPVRIASVSKLVVAIGVMRMVEDGALDLDRPVGDYLGYKVENPAYAGQKVTLRRLLSHTASLRDHDDQYAIPLGERLRDVLADPATWDSAHGPDARYFTYGNVNFPVIASVIERVTQTRFDHMMKLLVIDPMKLDACFNWPTCSDDRVARAVVLTQDGEPIRDDLHGRRPDCPVFVKEGAPCDLNHFVAGQNGSLFAPQGGLRISARDLAKFGRMLLGKGMVDGRRILSPESVELILTPLWRFDGANGETEHGTICAYGLASQPIATGNKGCRDNPGVPAGDWRGHPGEAYGLRSGLWIDRAHGRGIAYFVTGLPASPPSGSSAFTAAEEEMVARSLSLFSAGQSGSSAPRVFHKE